MRAIGRVLVVLLLAVPAARGEDPSLTFRESWSGWFAGSTGVFHIAVAPPDTQVNGFGWGLSVGGQVVARGEAGLEGITVNLPAVKEGVVLDAVLSVTALGAGRSEIVTTNKALHLFPANPFAGREEWLKRLKVQLFDPEHTTEEALAKLGVPFTLVRNPEAFAVAETRLILIGEGVSFEDYPGLADGMIRAAQAGRNVLCLAPSGGSFPLPGAADAQGVQPVALRFLQNAAITGLDQRIDAEAWPPDGRVVRQPLVLRSERQSVLADFSAGQPCWPWLDAEFPGGGRLTICGFAVMEKWEQGPASRWLLLRAMEAQCPNREEKKETKP